MGQRFSPHSSVNSPTSSIHCLFYHYPSLSTRQSYDQASEWIVARYGVGGAEESSLESLSARPQTSLTVFHARGQQVLGLLPGIVLLTEAADEAQELPVAPQMVRNGNPTLLWGTKCWDSPRSSKSETRPRRTKALGSSGLLGRVFWRRLPPLHRPVQLVRFEGFRHCHTTHS